MAFEKVEEAVLAEAASAAAATVAEAKRRQEEELARLREECEAAHAEALAEAAARSARETARQAGKARHAGRLEVLAAKNAVLDEVFRRAEKTLRELPEAEYMGVIRAWLDALPKDTGGELRVSQADAARFSDRFLAAVNAGRSEKGRIRGVRVDAAVKGGFVLEGEDFSIDQTIERRIESLRGQMAGELAKGLFGE
jgi:V/A-type H+-transporting ATPase subunit E